MSTKGITRIHLPAANSPSWGVLTGSDSIRFVRTLPGPIERVWSYIADDSKRAKWFAGGVCEPRVGGKFEMAFRHQDLSPVKEKTPEKYAKMDTEGIHESGTVTRWDPPRAFGYMWTDTKGGSDVLIELSPKGSDVELVLTHTRLHSRGMVLGVAGGWHTHLDVLVEVVRGDVPGPFWSRHNQLELAYETRLPKEAAAK